MVPILKHEVIGLSQVVIKGFYGFVHFWLLQKSKLIRDLLIVCIHLSVAFGDGRSQGRAATRLDCAVTAGKKLDG